MAMEVNPKRLHHHAVPITLLLLITLVLGLIHQTNARIVTDALVQPHTRVHPRPNGLASVTFHAPQNSPDPHSSAQDLGNDAMTSLILHNR
jgi:hypothetical protein